MIYKSNLPNTACGALLGCYVWLLIVLGDIGEPVYITHMVGVIFKLTYRYDWLRNVNSVVN